MKQKISIVIDAEIVRLAKQRATEEGWTLSRLIQEALVKHLRAKAPPRPGSGRWRTIYFANSQ